jgi:D-lactate dehydrogenase (cytochrome)/glycolate oxidase
MSDTTRRALVSQLMQFLPPERLLTESDRLVAYSFDATGERHRPDLVAIADTVGEAVKVMESAHRLGVVVIVRGSGSNLSGGTMPVVGGLVLALSRLRQIREVDGVNRHAVVEAGVVNADLQERLAVEGFFYPPDPASHRISTLGGNIAENSGGPHCVKYGVTTNHVQTLEVILADGSFRMTPPTGTERTGFDIAGLLTGSEGTLACVVGIQVHIAPKPPATRTMLAIFSRLDDAIRSVSAIVAAKIVPATLELLDRKSIEIIEPFVHAGYPVGAEAVLLIEVDGLPETFPQAVDTIRAVAMHSGAVEFREAQTPAEAEALWRGRRAHYGAAARMAPHLWVQDVTVPRPLLPAMVQDVLNIGQRWGFDILTAAHVGDGNLHPVITYDPANADEVRRMRQADHEILAACVQYGGSITGEHGIGIDKVEHLPLMYSAAELEIMQGLKTVFDPDHRLNPLKAILPVSVSASGPLEGAGDLSVIPTTVEEAQALIRAAYHRRQPLVVRGAGRRMRWDEPMPNAIPLDTRHWNRVRDFDRDNLTIEVEAGMTAGDLATLVRTEGLDLPGVFPGQQDTVGGLVASNLRMWRHPWSWRDWVLGVEWIDGQGRLLRFGRKTTKNVAGYDVSKLAVGSHGRLGVLTSVIFRLRPLAPDLQWLMAESTDGPGLLAEVLTLLTTPSRPEGALLVRDEQHWHLLLIGNHADRWAPFFGSADDLRTASDPLGTADAWDGWHQDAWENARDRRAYAEGGVKPSALRQIFSGLPPSARVALFPYSGAYEIFDAITEPLPGLLRRLDGEKVWSYRAIEWQDIEAGIARVFDPQGVFASVTKDVS